MQIHKDHWSNPDTQSTLMRIEQLQGKEALLKTWELQPPEILVQEHEYLLELRKQIRQVRSYIMHRRDASVDFLRRDKTNGAND
jgi:hypothetical protein